MIICVSALLLHSQYYLNGIFFLFNSTEKEKKGPSLSPLSPLTNAIMEDTSNCVCVCVCVSVYLGDEVLGVETMASPHANFSTIK